MQVDSVLILCIVPIGPRDFERYGLSYFLNKGLRVNVLNLQNLIYPDVSYLQFESISNTYDYKEINSYNELNQILKIQNKKTAILNFIGFHSKTFKMHFIISKFDIVHGAFFVNAIPNPYTKKIDFSSIVLKITEFWRSYTISTICLKFFEKLYFTGFVKILKFLGKIKSYDFVVVAGSESKKLLSNISKETKIISAHTMDFDFMLHESKCEDENMTKYILYLDEYLPYHPDFLLLGIDLSGIREAYYAKMNLFLDKLSVLYNTEVIICAHPRADYSGKNVWKNKNIVYNKTFEYVKKSLFCVTHASTSTNFAIMLNKPIVFLSLKEISFFYARWIKAFSDAIGKESISIDLLNNNDFTQMDILNINSKKYLEYKEKFISEDINDRRLFWDKVYFEFCKI